MKNRTVIIVMFDLSMENRQDRKSYTEYVKYLKTSGYIRYQKSVYVRLLKNSRNLRYLVNEAILNAPKTGTVSAFSINLEDFLKIKCTDKNSFDKQSFANDIVFA